MEFAPDRLLVEKAARAPEIKTFLQCHGASLPRRHAVCKRLLLKIPYLNRPRVPASFGHRTSSESYLEYASRQQAGLLRLPPARFRLHKKIERSYNLEAGALFQSCKIFGPNRT